MIYTFGRSLLYIALMENFQTARTNMVDGQIHTAGVVSAEILNAFETVPRERFVPEAMQNVAYSDEDLQISSGRYLLEPITHAKMVQAVLPRSDDVVLDIGGATGYSAAILSSLVTTVVALESNESFLTRAARLWEEIGAVNVVAMPGDLVLGNAENAPFSLIFMNGAVSEIPRGIVAQLEKGGRLITIVKKPGAVMGEVTLVKHIGDGDYSAYNLFSAGCPYLPGFAPVIEFEF